MARRDFKEADRRRMLLWCDRHCCLCGIQCGGNIEIHHVDGKHSNNNPDNGMPVCFNCHGTITAYGKSSKGSRFSVKELKERRNQIYDKYTSHLVSPILFEITRDPFNTKNPKNMLNLPKASFKITNTGNAFPVRAEVIFTLYLHNRKIKAFNSKPDYYNGQTRWRLNPGITHMVYPPFPQKVANSKKEFKIKVEVTAIDIYERPHKLLPLEFKYARDPNKDLEHWFLEP